jgi:heptosyltransferase I
MKKFLIVKTSSLGDIIQSFSVVSYLKNKFPDSQIDWVVEDQFSELVRAHPHITNTLCINTRAWRKWNNLAGIFAFRKLLRKNRYDAVFDLQSNVKSGFLTWQAKSKNKVGFGKESVHEWPNLLFTNRKYNYPLGENITDDYLFLAKSYLKDSEHYEASGVQLSVSSHHLEQLQMILESPTIQGRKIVMVCPGSAWPNKQMTEETLALFLQQVQKYLQCGFLFVWGTKEEQAISQRLQQQFPRHSLLVDRLPLPVLQNLMNRMHLVIAMDSLPLHLAGTTATSTFSIFGASLAAKFKPKGARHHAFQGACPYGQTFLKRCPILRTCQTGSCIRDQSSEIVFQSFRQAFPHAST